MADPFEKYLGDFSGGSGTTAQVIQIAETQCSVILPDDFRMFLTRHNGGEGFIGKHYLILWKAEQLQELNVAYQVDQYAKGLLLFGSSGGGDGFAFDTRKSPFRLVQVPFIGMSLEDAFFVAESFTRLLERMVEVDGALF
ncbi:MAG TPA: SMI1/KNR4 family protein [Verrucomicrobiae bacterium]|jgi:hypothetical protein|nr:SMI1/KNR4 family protein [Verrucomicrobiae bacterium]